MNEEDQQATRSELITILGPGQLARCDRLSMEHYLELGLSKSWVASELNVGLEKYDACKKLYGKYFNASTVTENIKIRIWEQYIHEKKSPKEIAEWHHITEWTILYLIEQWTRDVIQNPEKYAIEIPQRTFATYNLLKKAFCEDKKTLQQIAIELSVNTTHVKHLLRTMGLRNDTTPKPQYPHINHDGYKVILVDNRRILEYRYIWERTNGPIPKGMHIHHINWNKQDNRLENLDMLTAEDHLKLHALMIKETKRQATQDAHMEILKKVKLNSNNKELYETKKIEEQKSSEEVV